MGKYGNIDGIATLTNDPLALDNINKFNIGDRVMCNDNGVIGTVKKLDIPNGSLCRGFRQWGGRCLDRKFSAVQRIIDMRVYQLEKIFGTPSYFIC